MGCDAVHFIVLHFVSFQDAFWNYRVFCVSLIHHSRIYPSRIAVRRPTAYLVYKTDFEDHLKMEWRKVAW